MADSLKDSWKETGKGLGHAFRDLGKTLIKTGANVVNKVDDWANGEDENKTEENNKEETSE